MQDSLRLIYMAGGASYTLVPLKKILESKFKLLKVFTKYPKPSGREKSFGKPSTKIFRRKKNTFFFS